MRSKECISASWAVVKTVGKFLAGDTVHIGICTVTLLPPNGPERKAPGLVVSAANLRMVVENDEHGAVVRLTIDSAEGTPFLSSWSPAGLVDI